MSSVTLTWLMYDAALKLSSCTERSWSFKSDRRIEHLGVDLAAGHLAQTLQLLALRCVPFFLGDSLPGHLGHGIVAIGQTAVAFQAEERERRENKQQQQELHQALMVTDKFKHWSADHEITNK